MLSKLYKLIFDISVCYTIGAFLLKSIADITINAGSLLILLISVVISILITTYLCKHNRIDKDPNNQNNNQNQNNQNRKLIIFTTIFFTLGSIIVSIIFLRPSIPELVVFLLTCAYYSFVIISERFVISRGEFVDMLKYLLYLYLLLSFLILMFTTVEHFRAAVQVASPYLIITMVSAVFLLRHLRTDNQMEQMKQYSRQQFIELLIFLIISVVLTLFRAPQKLVEGLRLMYEHLFVPVLSFLFSILGVLMNAIIYLIIAAVSLLTNNKGLREIKIDSKNGSSQTLIKITNVKVKSIDWILPFVYAISIILGLVFLFFFFRKLMGEKFKQSTQSGILETREYLEDVNDRRAEVKLRHTKEPRAIVRYYYRKCMQLMQKKHVELTPQDTTQEINKKYNIIKTVDLKTDDIKAKNEASSTFMHIYRKARYQMSEDITKEEAEKSKQLYQAIKSIKLNK